MFFVFVCLEEWFALEEGVEVEVEVERKDAADDVALWMSVSFCPQTDITLKTPSGSSISAGEDDGGERERVGDKF